MSPNGGFHERKRQWLGLVIILGVFLVALLIIPIRNRIDRAWSRGVTIASASTMEKDVKAQIKDMTKTDAAKTVGKVVAERALAAGIKQVVFDRGGYLYTGRVQALADGAREAGLNF